MRRHPESLVKLARKLVVGEDLSYSEVAKRLRVPDTTVTIWCKGLFGTRSKALIERNEFKRKTMRESEAGVVNSVLLNKNLAKLVAGIIYGCEGSKYPAQSGVSLTNSDPNIIFAFVCLLRKAFKISEDKLRVHLQIHSDQNFEVLAKYWSELLNISRNKFYKPTITETNGKKHRNVYFGTCTIRYYDYKIQLKLIGICEYFMRKLALSGGVAEWSKAGVR